MDKINEELLKKICDRYGAKLTENKNKSGGFQLTEEEFQILVDVIKGNYFVDNNI